MANEIDDGAAKVRFRVVAPVGREPEGARFVLRGDEYTERFRAAFAGLAIEVPDAIGAGPSRVVVVSPRALSDLTLGGVIRADATLSGLAELAKKSPRGGADAWVASLVTMAGDGALARECRAIIEPTPVQATSSAPVVPSSALTPKDEIDALFERAESPARPTSATAVDAFIGAMRGAGPSAGAPKSAGASPDVARQLRDAVERAIFRVARSVLSHPTLARMESAWRALRWFVEQSPTASGVRLEIIDAPHERALELLSALPYEGDFEDPDLLAVVEPIEDVQMLHELAAFAEERLAPCVVTHASGQDPDGLIERLGAIDPGAREAYDALRGDDASRWLCIAHNDAILFDEGTGELSRTVLGSPVWALLASIAASYSATGSFARIVGQTGQLRAPATVTLATGRDAGTAIPTRHFASIRAQSELEKHGVLTLGSPRNSDRISLSSAPMVRAAKDAVPLPAQMWAGRIARFTSWVRAQLPAGASSEDAREIFEQAASVFLYPGTGRSAMVTAAIVESQGARTLQVAARIHGSHALVPLDLELALPLR